MNLVSGALKFSPADTVVSVSLSTDSSEIVPEVKGQGPGFTDKGLEKLYTAYVPERGITAASFSSGLERIRGFLIK
jgi:K+-sensing histidine kinase KdpD